MSDRRLPWLVAALVGGMVLSWLLIVPPGAQPDEHSHLVRSGALVLRADGDDGFYLLPDRYLMTDPGCYAFDPFTPASCAEPPDPTGEDIVVLTRADDYPLGGHLLTGVATLLPGLDPVWWARLASAAIATVFVASAVVLALRRSRLFAGALLVALTPMAWSSLPSANPSTYAIGGAAALWVALLTVDLRDRIAPSTAWLIAAGWTSLVVSRRDGLVWACIVVFAVAVYRRVALLDLARRLTIGPVVLAGLATASTLAWGLASDSRTSQLVVVAPLALVAAEVVRQRSGSIPPEARWWLIGIGAVSAVIAWPILVSTRRRGWDTDLTVTIINQTDDNLVEAIGRLGWLDAPIPAFAVYAWLIVIGGAVAYSLLTDRRATVVAGAVVVIAAVTSWTFELLQNNDSGTYWQGRYSLPLLIGVPLLLVARTPCDVAGRDVGGLDATIVRAGRQLTVWAAVTGVVVVNLGAWAAARRWGVGLDGSYLPWRWDTALQPVAPIVPLVALAACSAALVAVVLTSPPAGAENRVDEPAVA